MTRFTVPFQPHAEDLKLVVECDNGSRCCIFDTFCKSMTPEQKQEADRRILDICHRSAVAALIREEQGTGGGLP